MLVVELLKRGFTGGIEGVETTGQRLKEVQGVMDLLQTDVNVALKTVKTRFVSVRSVEDALQIAKVSSIPDVEMSNSIFTSSPQPIANSTTTTSDPVFNSSGHQDSSYIKIEPIDVVETDFSEVTSQYESRELDCLSLDDHLVTKSENKYNRHELKNIISMDNPNKCDGLKLPICSATCHVCDKLFASKLNMRKHVRTQHPEMTFSCHICNTTFILEGTLKRHIERVHEGIRFNCVQCPSNFSSMWNLSRHIRKKHGNEDKSRGSVGDDSGIEHHDPKTVIAKSLKGGHNKVVPCFQCNEYFSSRANMMRHIATVHEGQRFACEECNYKSMKKSRVIKHCIKSQHDSNQIKTVYVKSDAIK